MVQHGKLLRPLKYIDKEDDCFNTVCLWKITKITDIQREKERSLLNTVLQKVAKITKLGGKGEEHFNTIRERLAT